MIAVVAHGAISALGRGDAAYRARDERETTKVARDEELAAAGLKRPFCARADLSGIEDRGVDRATLLLHAALADCMSMLDRDRPRWRALRVGLAVGTSSGGMRAFEAGASGIAATYAGPVAGAVSRARIAFAPASIVLAACASSAIAIGLGKTWLEDDRCDVVLAGGFDAVSVFVAAGFECLRATSGERGPRPFRLDRDGLALGEGAAMVALARADATSAHVRAWIAGFGMSCDAHHLTSPDPAGNGLARAAKIALAEGGDPAVGLVSAHGTATTQNDGAEAKALAQLDPAPVFSFKGTIGHTLGAAGALETLATIDALERGIVPSTHGEGAAEAGADVRDRAAPSTARSALKLASAFGGANAALVITRDPPRMGARLASRDVFMTDAVHIAGDAKVDLERIALRSRSKVDRLARADDLVHRSLMAIIEQHAVIGGERSGIVIGLGLATVETNARFLARISRPEPRRFPYTTPNAAAGECAVAFNLGGPAFAVGGGPHGGIEALAIAADIVRAGIADRMFVVAVDEAGDASARLAPGTSTGAVGVVVQNEPSRARLERWGVSYEPSGALADSLPAMSAHVALLPLMSADTTELRAEVPWGGRASISWTLEPANPAKA